MYEILIFLAIIAVKNSFFEPPKIYEKNEIIRFATCRGSYNDATYKFSASVAVDAAANSCKLF